MSNAPKQLNFWIAEILSQGVQNNINNITSKLQPPV
jgi:hypothetical protein